MLARSRSLHLVIYSCKFGIKSDVKSGGGQSKYEQGSSMYAIDLDNMDLHQTAFIFGFEACIIVKILHDILSIQLYYDQETS